MSDESREIAETSEVLAEMQKAKLVTRGKVDTKMAMEPLTDEQLKKIIGGMIENVRKHLKAGTVFANRIYHEFIADSPAHVHLNYRMNLINDYGYWKKVEAVVVDFYITDYSVKNRAPIDSDLLW